MNPLKIINNIPFYLRRRFNKRYIVIESDDWGLSGANSKEGINYLCSQYGKDSLTRWTTDSFETSKDIELLFELLMKYKASFDTAPIITANYLTHNIDYSKKDHLSFVPLGQTLNDNKDIKMLCFEGIDNKIFCPQLHGYCHYDVIKLNNYFHTSDGKELFKRRFLTGMSTVEGHLHMFHSEFSNYNSIIKNNFELSIQEFQSIFQYKPISFIPPHFQLNNKMIKYLVKKGIISIQASNRLINSYNTKYNRLYFRKSQNIFWMPRNARLDPHPDYNYYSNYCIESIRNAFAAKVPSIIDFHRVNISGKFNSEYRDRSLQELEKVLKAVKRHWPDTLFISTPQLIKLCQITIK